MPEGPEVKTITDELHNKLLHRYVVKMSIDSSSKYFSEKSEKLPNYQSLIHQNLPIKITNITCKGKQIFFHLYSIKNNITIYLNSTLGMEGKWLWKSGKYSNFWLTVSNDIINGIGLDKKQLIIYIDSFKVYFDDMRHFGNLSILSEQGYNNKLKEIGPDLLNEDVTETVWLEKSRNKRIINKQICVFLMDQKYFSGIGNYLKAEILYKAKIKPDRVLSDLSDQELKNILKYAKLTIKESYQYGGLSIRTYLNPDGKKGTYSRDIYEKEKDPLGNAVIKSKFKDGRTTHWVPSIQI